jgi:hypothetical protein
MVDGLVVKSRTSRNLPHLIVQIITILSNTPLPNSKHSSRTFVTKKLQLRHIIDINPGMNPKLPSFHETVIFGDSVPINVLSPMMVAP